MYADPLDTALGGPPAEFSSRCRAAFEARRRPCVSLCWAQTLDGCTTIERGSPTAISGPLSRRLTHGLRAAHRALLVGIGTVLADDPLLTVREVPGQSPRPVVLDSRLRLPVGSRLLAERRDPIVYCSPEAERGRREELIGAGALVRVVDGRGGELSIERVLEDLGALEIESLMVEGGATVITSFLRLGLADRVAVTVAPLLAGGYHAVAPLRARGVAELPRLRRTAGCPVGDDFLIAGDLR